MGEFGGAARDRTGACEAANQRLDVSHRLLTVTRQCITNGQRSVKEAIKLIQRTQTAVTTAHVIHRTDKPLDSFVQCAVPNFKLSHYQKTDELRVFPLRLFLEARCAVRWLTPYNAGCCLLERDRVGLACERRFDIILLL